MEKAEKKTSPIRIRDFIKDDVNFIFATWLNSYWTSCPYLTGIHKDDFYNGHKVIVAKLLSKSTILIACDAEDEDMIFGYIVFNEEPSVLHYVYVRGPSRRFGIATHLLKSLSNNWEVSHWTESIEEYLAKSKSIVYNPYLALGE